MPGVYEAYTLFRRIFDYTGEQHFGRNRWAHLHQAVQRRRVKAYLVKIALDAKQWDEAREWFPKVRQAAHDGFVDTPGLAAASLGWEGDAELASDRPSAAAQ